MPAIAAPLSLPTSANADDQMAAARATLENVFGYKGFRPLQSDIIATLLSGGDCLALMPTGGGKSLCYQIPALVRPGTGIVVSPLIALMQDQVDALARPRRQGRVSEFDAGSRDAGPDRAAVRGRRARPALRCARATRAGAHAQSLRAQRHRALRHRRSALRLAMGPRFPARVPPAQNPRRRAFRTCRA